MDPTSDSLLPWYWLRGTPGVGPSRIRLLLDTLGTPEQLLHFKAEDYVKVATVGRKLATSLEKSKENLHLTKNQVEQDLEKATSLGARIVTLQDESYPPRLKAIVNVAPPILYILGDINALNQNRAIAIVGTRNPSSDGIHWARRFASELASMQVSIISGLAKGIDTASHLGAIDSQGWTVAVLGSGVDTIFPRQNKDLAASIIEQGAIVSEYAFGTRTNSDFLRKRNHIIVALSDGVIAVEHPLKSGTEITVEKSLEQGKALFAFHHADRIPESAQGSVNLITARVAYPLTSPTDSDSLIAALDAFAGIRLSIIFDLDGVLVDTRNLERSAMREAIRSVDGEAPSDRAINGVLHQSPRQALLSIGKGEKSSLLEAYQTYWTRFVRHDVRSKPLLKKALKEISHNNVKLAIVTSRNRSQAERLLSAAGLAETFQTLVTWGDTSSHKPSPEPIQFAIRQMGETDAAVYLGDRIEDYQAAIAADTQFIGIGWHLDIDQRDTLEASGATNIIIRPVELTRALDRARREAWVK